MRVKVIMTAFILFLHCVHSLPASEEVPAGHMFYDTAVGFMRSDNYDKAITFSNRALHEYSGQTGQKFFEILECRALLANAYWYSGNVRKGAEMMRLCAEDLEAVDPLEERLAPTYLFLAEYCLYSAGSFSGSEKFLELTRQILDRYPGRNDLRGILYFLKGYLNYQQNDYENAYELMNQSVRIVSEYSSLSRYLFLNYRYLMYLRILIENDYIGALDRINRIIQMKGQSSESLAVFHFLKGKAYMRLKDSLNAERSFIESIDQASLEYSAINNSTLYRSYHNLSLLNRNNRQKKLECLKKAFDHAYRISPTDKDVIIMYYHLGKYYYDDKNFRTALQYAQKALIASSSAFHDTSVLVNPVMAALPRYYAFIDILSLKAYALVRAAPADRKYLESALQCTEIAMEMIRNRITDIDEETSGLRIAENERQVFNNAVTYANRLYKWTGNIIYAEKAFRYSELGKVLTLHIHTIKDDLLERSGIPDTLIRYAEHLSGEISDLENRIVLNRQKGNQKLVNYLNSRLMYLYDQRDRLNLRFMEEYPAYRNARYDLKVPDLSEIQSSLGPDQALLEYQFSLRLLVIFVITDTNFYVYSKAFGKEPRMHIENLRSLLSVNPALGESDTSFASFCNSSAYLYDFLIRPVYDRIKGRRLVIIPHNELYRIPFETLISEQGKDYRNYQSLPWLISEFPVSYALSANFLFDGDRNRKPENGFAVFVPDYGNHSNPDLNSLEGTKREARLLKWKTNAHLFNGKAASESNFRNKAPGYRILHLASHTIIDESKPDLSCFVMNPNSDSMDDGLLYSYEIKQLKLNAQLVVLSGCNTGYGRLRLSEGLISLTRSLFYAGIRTVAFTLWQVPDHSTSQLITRFYDGLRHRETLDVALKKAKNEFFRSTDPVRSHPYYWAGFMIAGNSEAITLNRFTTGFKLVWTILILVIAGFYIRKRISVRALKPS